ncbi:MAG: hypothetical protein EPO40_04290 [Myxococcaceae bacterium]|nr:MAG: hypothetical protein EPO40_04290 [Myxococcaceae bacterium]
MRLRRPRTLAFVVRLVLALLLATFLSGVPAFAAPVLGFEDSACDADCPSSDDAGHCPPNCTHGDCAKIHLAPLPDAVIPPLVVPAPALLPVPSPPPRLLSRWHPGDVFHPPRA